MILSFRGLDTKPIEINNKIPTDSYKLCIRPKTALMKYERSKESQFICAHVFKDYCIKVCLDKQCVAGLGLNLQTRVSCIKHV